MSLIFITINRPISFGGHKHKQQHNFDLNNFDDHNFDEHNFGHHHQLNFRHAGHFHDQGHEGGIRQCEILEMIFDCLRLIFL